MDKAVESITNFWNELQNERSGMKLYEFAVDSASYIKSILSTLNSLITDFNLRDVFLLSVLSKYIRLIIKDDFLSQDLLDKINLIINSENYGFIAFQQTNDSESLEGSIELVSVFKI